MQKKYHTNIIASDFYLAVFQGIVIMQQRIPESVEIFWPDTATPG
jgi:hypothetical protein